jgi:hypothetical protein
MNIPPLWLVFLSIPLNSSFIRAQGYTVVNNIVKEVDQASETVTYGSFKVGAYRDAYDVPINFGKLVSVIPFNGGAIFWFENDQGTLRNVMIDDVSKPLIIHRQGIVTAAP